MVKFPKIPSFRKPAALKLGHVLITGSSRGIGRALAEELSRYASRITLCARTEADLRDVKKSLCSSLAKIDFLICNLDSFEAGSAFGGRVRERFGDVDTLVLNAGTASGRNFADAHFDDIERELGVNYLAPIGLTQSLLPSLRRRPKPRLVVISSLTAVVPFPGNATYAATKAALNAWVRTLALEEKKSKLEVLLVLPGLTDTKLTQGQSSLLPAMSAAAVAGQVRESLMRGERLVVPGFLNQIAHRCSRHLPDEFDSFVAAAGQWLIPGRKDISDDK